MSEETRLDFQEMPKPFLSRHRCGCGKQARYYHQDVPYVSAITYSCNKYAACFTYEALEAENAALKAQLDFCAKAVSQLRESDDGFEIRLVDEPLSASFRGGKWYKGKTFREAIDAAMKESEGE